MPCFSPLAAGVPLSLGLFGYLPLSAVGYQNGQVIVWDLSTQAIVKALNDIHKAPVVHVRFLNEYSQLISGDVSGTCGRAVLHVCLLV